jgi:hypothetical protein
MKEKTKFFILTISGILFAYILFQSYHFDNLFQIFFYTILGGIGLFILFNGIFNDIEKFKKTKELKSYSLTFIGIILIILNLGIFIYYEIKLNSETLLKAENHGVFADFKKNGNYIIKSGSWATKKHFYGKYYIKDSIIIVDKNYYDEALITNKFVIRRIINALGKEDNGKIKNYLIELDQNNKEIKNLLVDFDKSKNAIYDSRKFEIVTDNRK